jgi:hypothetical protein
MNSRQRCPPHSQTPLSLKVQGIPTEFRYYPREAHTLVQPENRADLRARIFEWIAERDLGEESSSREQ